MTPQEIQEINKAIKDSNAKWKAGETTLTRLPKTEQLKRLGYVPGPGEKSLQERERISKVNLETFRTSANAVGFPVTYDLRNVGGQNFITRIKDQGRCGSCVAFGIVATVEGMKRKEVNNSNLNVDLSEAHLFYCYGRNEGRNCDNGWWPDNALNHFKNEGVVDEACYTYTAGDQNCSNLCSDWNNRLTKITNWHSMVTVADMKNWISSKGPLVTCFTVYRDFYAYSNGGGIYSHVWGEMLDGHCVCVVGYNDPEQYWICKNSWGTGWGESGFFRIAYGQVGIDAEMWAVDGVVGMGNWLRCLYLDLLNREPDQQGFNYWINAINAGTTILSVADGFLRSQEYCTNLANSLYNQLLDRGSDPSGLNVQRDYLMRGNSLQDTIIGFCQSLEYKSKHPVPNQFVESLYNKLLGRPSDPSGLQYWINLINSGTNTADVIRGFLRSREYALQRLNEFYQKFLGRQPDTNGLEFWANKLQNGTSLQEITTGFLTSIEYQNRALAR